MLVFVETVQDRYTEEKDNISIEMTCSEQLYILMNCNFSLTQSRKYKELNKCKQPWNSGGQKDSAIWTHCNNIEAQ